jgi:hypothetical protein
MPQTVISGLVSLRQKVRVEACSASLSQATPERLDIRTLGLHSIRILAVAESQSLAECTGE